MLRQSGQPDATLGWDDSHGHPYCLRLEEALTLSARIATHPDWQHSPIPFLLLHPFIGLTTVEEADACITHQAKALKALGVLPEAPLLPDTPAPPHDLAEQLGWINRAYRCGDISLRATAQTACHG